MDDISELGQVVLFDQFYVSFDFMGPVKKRKRRSGNFDASCYTILFDHALVFCQGPQIFGIVSFGKSSLFYARSGGTSGPIVLTVIMIEWTALDGIRYKIQLTPCSDLEKSANTCYTWIRKINTHFQFTNPVHDWPIVIENKVQPLIVVTI
jgi:hypothetical protein